MRCSSRQAQEGEPALRYWDPRRLHGRSAEGTRWDPLPLDPRKARGLVASQTGCPTARWWEGPGWSPGDRGARHGELPQSQSPALPSASHVGEQGLSPSGQPQGGGLTCIAPGPQADGSRPSWPCCLPGVGAGRGGVYIRRAPARRCWALLPRAEGAGPRTQDDPQ